MRLSCRAYAANVRLYCSRRKAEAQRLIADANRTIENTIRTIREAQAEKEATRQARRELETFRGGGGAG